MMNSTSIKKNKTISYRNLTKKLSINDQSINWIEKSVLPGIQTLSEYTWKEDIELTKEIR